MKDDFFEEKINNFVEQQDKKIVKMLKTILNFYQLKHKPQKDIVVECLLESNSNKRTYCFNDEPVLEIDFKTDLEPKDENTHTVLSFEYKILI